MRYSLEDVCRLTGLSPHAVRACMRHRSIIPERQTHNRRKYDLSSADVASIQEAARELWPDETAAQPHAAAADLSALQGRLDALERRVRALETRQHAPAVSPVPREPHGPIHVALPLPRPPHVEVRAVGPSQDGETRTAIAAWLSHHGIAFNTSRHWFDMPLDRAGALTYAVAHKARVGYRAAYAIHPCADVVCACRDVLEESGTK